MNKLIINFVIIIFCLVALSFVISGLSEDSIAHRTFGEITPSTQYRLEGKGRVSIGRLGKFDHCVRDYRSILQKKVNKDGEVIEYILTVSEDTYFKMSTVQNEVYMFTITFAEEGLAKLNEPGFHSTERSKSYAVNCNLSLLDEHSNELDK